MSAIEDIGNDLSKNSSLLAERRLDALLKLLAPCNITPEQLAELKAACLLDISKDIAEPDYLLNFGGIGAFPLGDVQAVKGMAKHGKSYLCSLIVASVLGCDTFGITTNHTDSKVIYFDTEQNDRNAQKLQQRIHALLGWNPREPNVRLQTYPMRKFTTAQRAAFVDLVTREEKPTAIVVDGIADLIDDFNDVAQSQKIVLDLMKLSAEVNCACICVLHEARTSGDGGMKGHLGSLLLQKVSDCLESKKVDSVVFNVTQTETRNRPIDKFSFVINGEGLPEPADEYNRQKAQERAETAQRELRENIVKAFGDNKELERGIIVTNLQPIIDRGKRTCESRVSEAITNHIIERGTNGNYYVLPE